MYTRLIHNSPFGFLRIFVGYFGFVQSFSGWIFLISFISIMYMQEKNHKRKSTKKIQKKKTLKWFQIFVSGASGSIQTSWIGH